MIRRQRIFALTLFLLSAAALAALAPLLEAPGTMLLPAPKPFPDTEPDHHGAPAPPVEMIMVKGPIGTEAE